VSSYTIPNVIAQHPRGERIMDVYSHLLTERIVYLGTGIDPGVANTLIAQLLHLEADSAEQEINLYINCEGGDLPSDARRVRHHAVRRGAGRDDLRGPGHRRRRGAAGGGHAGPARPAAARPGGAAPARGRGQGPIPDLILQADELVRMRADIESILSAHTGQSVQTLRADTDRDRVLTAQAALDYGIVDQVLGQRRWTTGGQGPRARLRSRALFRPRVACDCCAQVHRRGNTKIGVIGPGGFVHHVPKFPQAESTRKSRRAARSGGEGEDVARAGAAWADAARVAARGTSGGAGHRRHVR
jgi:ATP-dependent Clp protease protease subunit